MDLVKLCIRVVEVLEQFKKKPVIIVIEISGWNVKPEMALARLKIDFGLKVCECFLIEIESC